MSKEMKLMDLFDDKGNIIGTVDGYIKENGDIEITGIAITSPEYLEKIINQKQEPIELSYKKKGSE